MESSLAVRSQRLVYSGFQKSEIIRVIFHTRSALFLAAPGASSCVIVRTVGASFICNKIRPIGVRWQPFGGSVAILAQGHSG
eukprot:6081182-Lingulodinium_polyedra.AAC.1